MIRGIVPGLPSPSLRFTCTAPNAFTKLKLRQSQLCPHPRPAFHTAVFRAHHYSNALFPIPLHFTYAQSLRAVFMEQARQHSGHSHGAGHNHHHHDNTYLTSANKKDAGVRITKIGLYVNLMMAVGKGFGGWFFHSHALIADAGHALTDLVSDFMTLGTVAWALTPPTARFPTGYGKVESLGSLGVSSLLLTGGVLMGLNASDVLCNEFFGFQLFSAGAPGGHSHAHPVSLNAMWLAAGSIVVKEWLYRASKLCFTDC